MNVSADYEVEIMFVRIYKQIKTLKVLHLYTVHGPVLADPREARNTLPDEHTTGKISL